MQNTNSTLNTAVETSVQTIHNEMQQRGDLVAPEKLKSAYELFKRRFGPDVLKPLEGENLLNLVHGRGEKDSLVYWLEFKNDIDFQTRQFGSISGGSALKFGVYKAKESGDWMKGQNNTPAKTTVDEAIRIVTRQRDQLVAAAEAIKDLPPNADDEAYSTLQKKLNDVAPDVCDVAWGHKYLYLLFPDKCDDYHVNLWQRHHLIKLLLLPCSTIGLFSTAGQFVRLANRLSWPMNHLTAVLNKRDGNPIKYWRIGTKLGEGNDAEDIWPAMSAGGFAAIGWPRLGSLSNLLDDDEARNKIYERFGKEYKNHDARTASRKAGEVKNFAIEIAENDVVLAADGTKIRGVGLVKGNYTFDTSDPVDAPHRRPVEWHVCTQWDLPVSEGLRTTVYPLKDNAHILIEAEKSLLEPAKRPDTNSAESQEKSSIHSQKLPFALNTILYGPPGTGKTYRLRTHYMEKYFTDRTATPTGEELASALVKDLSWWEVIALALLDSEKHRAPVAEILKHPLVEARVKLSTNNNPRAMVWSALQNHTKDECQNVKHTSRSQPLLFEKDENSLWSIDLSLVEKETPELTQKLETYKNPDVDKPPAVIRYRFTTFHQSFSYEDFIEGIKPQLGDGITDSSTEQVTYEIKDGIFKEMCRDAKENPSKNYAIFIDEINRGNVASIFGELITLIEDDKRLGEKNEITAILPYSRKEFGVPNNLYIIGTMNTADRSVEALDTALRRRFVFEEMRPNRDKIPEYPAGQLELSKLFDVINDRIERLLDHDHRIGHAYFMGIRDLDSLRSVFANKILPLLREYFYGNPAKVGMVLGEKFVTRQESKCSFAPGSWGFDDLDDKEVFVFADVNKLTEEDFVTIYAEEHSSI